jgi:hypothetical protein
MLCCLIVAERQQNVLFLAHKGNRGKEIERRSFAAGYNHSQSKLRRRS